MSYRSIAMIWLADICAVVTLLSDDEESPREEEGPCYINSEFSVVCDLDCN